VFRLLKACKPYVEALSAVSDVKYQANIIDVLAQIVKDQEGAMQFGAVPTAFGVAIEMLQSSDGQILHPTLRLLLNVCTSAPALQAKLVQWGALPYIFKLLSNTDDTIQEAALHVLVQMATDDASRAALIKANIDVARLVLSSKTPITPTLLRVKATQTSDIGQVIYANSITLTPGTISVDVANNEILVHALSRDGAESLKEGEMDRRVTRMVGEDR